MLKKYSLISILAAIFLVCVTLFGIGVSNNKVNAAENEVKETRVYSGIEMTNGKNTYQLDSSFNSSIKTLEAMVRLSGSKNGLGRCGVVMGGFGASENGENYFNFEFDANRKPRLYWKAGASATAIDWVVNYSLSAWGWYHVAFVRDTVADKIYCYVNGEVVGTRDGAGADIPTPTAKHWVGRDGRDGSSTGTSFLMGVLNYVGISSTAYSAQDVAKNVYDSKRIITSNDSGSLYTKDFSQKAQTYYRVKERLTAAPITFTATIKLPTSATGYSGVIMGTFADGHGASLSRDTFNVEVTTGGFVRVIWDPGKFEKVSGYMDSNNIKTDANNTADVVFDTPVNGYSGNLNVNTGSFVHVAIVRDRANGVFHLYINGVLASTKGPSTSGAINALKTNFIPLFPVAIGRDSRSALEYRQAAFTGEIKDVAIYSTAFTSALVSNEYAISDKTTINNTQFESLLANYVLDSNQQSLRYDKSYKDTLTDYSKYANNAYVCTNADYYVTTEDWTTASEDEYTMIYLPDTQCTVRSQPHYTDAMFDWIVNNKSNLNISFVMGVGDIIDGTPLPGEESTSWEELNTEEQWDRMQLNYQKLSSAGIMYSAIVGNHDYDSKYLDADKGRAATNYNTHFGRNALASNVQATIVESYNKNDSNDMLNAIYEYTATTANGTKVKYLVLAMEFGPSDDTLAWASEVISRPEYVNHRVLFNTHSLMYSNGEIANAYTLSNPEHYAWAWGGDINLNNGTQMWDEFLSQHDNMFLTASGHIGSDTLIHRNDTGVYGNSVMSMLMDAQDVKYHGDIDGSAGWGDPVIVVAKVNEKTKTIKYYYYNPVNNMLIGVENKIEYDFSNALKTKQLTKSESVDYDKEYGTIGEKVEFTLKSKNLL